MPVIPLPLAKHHPHMSPSSSRIAAVEDILLHLPDAEATASGADVAALSGAVRGLLRRVAALESSRAALLERVASLQHEKTAAESSHAESTAAALARAEAAEARACRAESAVQVLRAASAADEAALAASAATTGDVNELLLELERREAARLEAVSRCETYRALAAAHSRSYEAAVEAQGMASNRAVAAEAALEKLRDDVVARARNEAVDEASRALLSSLLSAPAAGNALHAASTAIKSPYVGAAVCVLADAAAAKISDTLRLLATHFDREAHVLGQAAASESAPPDIRLQAARGASLRSDAAAAASAALALVTSGPEAVVVECSAESEALARHARLPLRSSAARRAAAAVEHRK